MLDRDILKADSAYVEIPEIHLEMAAGSLGGVYTTVEGLLDKIRKNIEEGNPFAVGDSDGKLLFIYALDPCLMRECNRRTFET